MAVRLEVCKGSADHPRRTVPFPFEGEWNGPPLARRGLITKSDAMEATGSVRAGSYAFFSWECVEGMMTTPIVGALYAKNQGSPSLFAYRDRVDGSFVRIRSESAAFGGLYQVHRERDGCPRRITGRRIGLGTGAFARNCRKDVPAQTDESFTGCDRYRHPSSRDRLRRSFRGIQVDSQENDARFSSASGPHLSEPGRIDHHCRRLCIPPDRRRDRTFSYGLITIRSGGGDIGCLGHRLQAGV